jgi:hypothetical protein
MLVENTCSAAEVTSAKPAEMVQVLHVQSMKHVMVLPMKAEIAQLLFATPQPLTRPPLANKQHLETL